MKYGETKTHPLWEKKMEINLQKEKTERGSKRERERERERTGSVF